MNKGRLWLIIKREYMSIVAKKSFIFTTLLMPIIMVACMVIPVALAQLGGGEDKKIAVIDETGVYGKALVDDSDLHFVQVGDGVTSPHEVFNKDEELYAVVLIPQDVLESKRVNVYSNNSVTAEVSMYLGKCLNDTLTHAKIASYNIADLQQILNECNVDVDVRSIKWGDDGKEQVSSAELASIFGLILSLVTYMFVLLYGAMIMNSVIEEKTNRIVEVIVSSCKPIELMLGKIIGVALVGITQITIWVALVGTVISVAGMAFLAPTIDANTLATAQGAVEAVEDGGANLLQAIFSIDFLLIVPVFVLYFIGGFFLYASIFAGLSSAVDQPSDASQFTTPVMMIIIIALYAAIGCMSSPDGDLAFWCSMIPFTSPMVMMIRLPFDVPMWQIGLSLAILFVSAYCLTYLSGRMFRRGILMYGKKQSFKDVIKWIK